ncbi:MAG: hypothetical protein MUE58_05790 [Chitinophagaceae bacterium]|jgi:hypothetical protein|nr:hypothetical protein [Chitinophagaceae bacterium]
MKKFISLLLICTLAKTAVFSQSDKYVKAMEDKLAQVEKTGSADGWKDLANGFERIADVEKSQWLPYYYAALSRVMGGYMLGNGQAGGFADKTDPEADKADELISKALSLSGENSEIWCIRKMIATLRMSADPMNRWQTYGPAAAEALQKAKQMDPANPRVYLLEGQDKFYTPEQFGGSKSEAKALFEEALKKFESFKPATPIHPTWGASQAKYFLGQIQ